MKKVYDLIKKIKRIKVIDKESESHKWSNAGTDGVRSITVYECRMAYWGQAGYDTEKLVFEKYVSVQDGEEGIFQYMINGEEVDVDYYEKAASIVAKMATHGDDVGTLELIKSVVKTMEGED